MQVSTTLSRRLAAALAAATLLTACGGTGDDDAAPTTDDATTDDAMADDGESMADDGDATADEGDAMVALGELATLTATTAAGETIAIGDLAGEDVLVETFATWCSNCRRQLGDTQTAAAEAGDDAVFLALSVETDLDPAALEQYATENGFDDIRFAVLDDDGLVTLQQLFGGSVLSPPSTPKFRVDADGTVSELTTGFESAAEILASLGA